MFEIIINMLGNKSMLKQYIYCASTYSLIKSK